MSTMRLDPLGDSDLLGLVAGGNRDAFALLFRRHRALVYRFVLHMTASPAIADDVAQDVFMAVMDEAGRYDASRASVASWLCGIARNHVRRRAERDRRLEPFLGDEGDEDPAEQVPSLGADVLGDLTRAERIEALRNAVLTLPVRYREVVVLCDLQELSYADTAEALGCAVGTVRSRLHRARGLLAAKMTAVEGRTTAERDATLPARSSDMDHDPLGGVKTLRALRTSA